LNEFIIATSADRDANITSYVIARSAKRESDGKFSVIIRFWEDIYGWLSEFPDILYKYFTKYFPQSELQELKGIDSERNKVTIEWPTGEDVLQEKINETLREITRIDPYKITLGISTFDDVGFDSLVDLKVSLVDCISDPVPENGFLRAAGILRAVKNIVKPPFYSNEMFVHLHSRLPYALLFGWMFRKVTGYEFKIYSSNQIWATSDLPLMFTHLQDAPPEMINLDSKDLIFVLNISRDINRQVNNFVATWEDKPRAILSYRYLTSSRVSPALGISIALEISQRIKSFKDNWEVRKIHLFGAMPAGLGALIGYNLNSICPISIYYMNNNDSEFHIGGTLTNDM